MPTVRTDARLRVSLPVALAGDTVRGNTLDLSVSGMRVSVPGAAPVPERTDFRLLLPTGQAVHGECRLLRRHEPGQWAVVFSSVLPADMPHLRLFLCEALGPDPRAMASRWG